MSTKPRHVHARDLHGLGRLAIDATLGITGIVETMHHSISRVPGPLGKSTQKPTKGITGLVYRSIRGVTRLVGGGVDLALANLASLVGDEPSSPHPEVNLSAPLGSRRLVARYDLIVAALGESLVIYDWKTSRQRPDRGHLEQHLQTRVYPYLLVRAGWHLNRGLLVQPDQVEMVYWFAGEDEPVERFIYSAEAFQTDESYLTGLLLPSSDWRQRSFQERAMSGAACTAPIALFAIAVSSPAMCGSWVRKARLVLSASA